MTSISKLTTLTIWRVYFLLAALQGIGVLALMLGDQSESGSIVLLGLSRTRFIIVASVLILTFAFAWLLIETWIKPKRTERKITWLLSCINRRIISGITLLTTGVVFLAGCYFITLTPEITEPFTRRLFERLLPLAIWGTGLSAQTLIALLMLHYRLIPKIKGKFFIIVVILFGGIYLVWLWMAKSIISQPNDVIGWNNPGAPILEFQVLLAWIGGMTLLLILILAINNKNRLSWLSKMQPWRLDLILCLFIWLGSVILWQSVSISPSWFVSEPSPPNQEYYPTSDARHYDITAQTALVGEGFIFQRSLYIRRSMHALYLTILHLLGGQNYETIVFLQVLVLALIPVMLYLITKTIHNRISALMAALLIMLREANSISVAGSITASHVKLLMVDLPVTLLVLCFVYFALLWLKQIENKKIIAVVCGGILGCAMLIRLETFVLALAIAAITGVTLFQKKRPAFWIQQMLLFTMAIMLVISPWVWRNWRLSGRIAIASPIFPYALLIQRFRPMPTLAPMPTQTPSDLVQAPLAPPPLSSPTPENAPSPTQASSGQGKPRTVQEIMDYAQEGARDYIISHPTQVAQFMVGHFLNSEIQTILYLPTTFRAVDSFAGFLGHRTPSTLWFECCSSQNYIRRMPYFDKWNGQFPRQAIIPLLVNLLLFTVGLQVAWKRNNVIGITPILLGTTYILFNAIFRNSGGRYILPVDWYGALYFSIGLAYLSTSFINYISNANVEDAFLTPDTKQSVSEQPEHLYRSPKFYAITIGLFLLGCSIPWVENIFPQRFTWDKRDHMLDALMQSDLILEDQRQDLESFMSKDGIVFAGRPLYPQYFPPHKDNYSRDNDRAQDSYSRIIFYLAGPYSSNFTIPLDRSPKYFPNGADVLVIGCPVQEVALAAAIFDSAGRPEAVIWQSLLPTDLSCPLPLPVEFRNTGEN